MTTALSTVHAGPWDPKSGWRADPEDIADDTTYVDPEDVVDDNTGQSGSLVEE
jgi:hypothetical protein